LFIHTVCTYSICKQLLANSQQLNYLKKLEEFSLGFKSERVPQNVTYTVGYPTGCRAGPLLVSCEVPFEPGQIFLGPMSNIFHSTLVAVIYVKTFSIPLFNITQYSDRDSQFRQYR
jgi:hypothetical protein